MGSPFSAEAFVSRAAAGDLAAVRLFLTAGMNIGALKPKFRIGLGDKSALYSASAYGRTEVVSYLIAKGAKLEHENDYHNQSPC
ncbi:MAG: hypothetical protein AAF493_00930 [Pseudomonadota bacterium]